MAQGVGRATCWGQMELKRPPSHSPWACSFWKVGLLCGVSPAGVQREGLALSKVRAGLQMGGSTRKYTGLQGVTLCVLHALVLADELARRSSAHLACRSWA